MPDGLSGNSEPEKRRIACIDCRLIEPAAGTWIKGRCPRCAPFAPKAKRSKELHPRTSRGRTAANRKDLTGLQFGRLTVTGYAFTRNKKAFWKCRCECGKSCIVAGSHLRRGRIVSCGCFRREIGTASGKKSIAIQRRNALKAGLPRKLSKKFTGARLTADQALAIRIEYAQGGITHDDLAAKYGVSDSAINAVLRQQSWRDVGGPLAPTRNKVTVHDVRAIREEYANGGISQEQLAERYGISRPTVTLIINRKNWKNVE